MKAEGDVMRQPFAAALASDLPRLPAQLAAAIEGPAREARVELDDGLRGQPREREGLLAAAFARLRAERPAREERGMAGGRGVEVTALRPRAENTSGSLVRSGEAA